MGTVSLLLASACLVRFANNSAWIESGGTARADTSVYSLFHIRALRSRVFVVPSSLLCQNGA